MANEPESNQRKNDEIATKQFLEKVLFLLYSIWAAEIAIMILANDGGWFALLAPVLAAFGPRYWRGIEQQVRFYTGFVIFVALLLLCCLPKSEHRFRNTAPILSDTEGSWLALGGGRGPVLHTGDFVVDGVCT